MEKVIYNKDGRKLVFNTIFNFMTWTNEDYDELIYIKPVNNVSDRIATMKFFREKHLPEQVLNCIERQLRGQFNDGNEWLWDKWKQYQYQKYDD